MSRIRTVKPELFKHEGLFEAEERYQLPLRLAFIGLFTCCDRQGRFRWKPRRLKVDIFPYDSVDMGLILNALAKYDFIVPYEVQGVLYGCIPSWEKHQCINHRESESSLPDVQKGMILDTPVEQRRLKAPVHLLEPCLTREARITNASATSPVSATEMPFTPDGSVLQSSATVTSPVMDELSTHKAAINAEAGVQTKQALGAITENMDKRKELYPFIDASATREAGVNHADQARPGMREGKGKEYGREYGKEQEREKEGCGEEKPKLRAPSVTALKIFSYWQRVMNHPRAVLDKSRQRCIQQALAMGYDVEALCQAIEGCALTPHNMGQNDRSERYDGLHIIFKSADQIDRFMRNAQSPPRILGKSEQRLQNNINAAELWLNQNNATEASHGRQ